MRITRLRPSAIWASSILIPGIFVLTGSLPIDITTRRTLFGLVASAIILAAAGGVLLIRHRLALSMLLGLCAAALGTLLMAARTFTEASQLPVSMVIAAMLAVMITVLWLKDPPQEGHKPLELFAANLIILTPVWALYSVPAGYAHKIEVWPGAVLLLALVWGIPLIAAALVSRATNITTRQLLLNVITGAISTLFTLALIEGAIRAIGLDQVQDREYSVTVATTKRYPGTPENPGDYVANSVGEELIRVYDLRGNVTEHTVTYSINSAGFRDDEFTLAKPEGVYRVAFVGDSFAFGLGAQQDKIVAHLLGPLLSKETGCNIEVYNFGQSGYSTINEAAQFRDKVVDYDPDMVIVWYFLNDPNIKGTTVFLSKFDTSVFFPIAQQYSALARAASVQMGTGPTTREMIQVYYDGYATFDHRWLDTVSSLNSIAELAREREITPVLAVHPVLFQLDDSYPFAGIHAQVMQAAQDAGFYSYDLFPAFKGQRADALWVSPVNQHPNEAGHAMAAQFIAGKLKDLIPPCNQ